METTDGLTLAIGGTAFGSLCTLVGSWIKARYAKTTVEPTPLPIEQSASQASWKANAHDHENMFSRIAKVEQDVARVDAKVDAKFGSIEKQLDRMGSMIQGLYDRIVLGSKRK